MEIKSISLDDIRNILIILTSVLAIGGIVLNTSNDIFIESVKAKYRNNIENKSFIEILIQAIFYMIIAVDIIGVGLYILMPLAGEIYSILKQGNFNTVNENINSFKSDMNGNVRNLVNFVMFFVFFFTGLIGALFFCLKIRQEYIKKLHGHNLLDNINKLKNYRKTIVFISVISAFNIVFLFWMISTIIVQIKTYEFLAILILMVNSFGNLIVLINLKNICDVIQENSLYKLVLSDETVYCRIYLEYRDYYMVHKDNRERYIKKSEVKEIIKETSEDIKYKKKTDKIVNYEMLTQKIIERIEKKLNKMEEELIKCFNKCKAFAKKYKSLSILILLMIIFLGPILAAQGYFKLFVKWLFNTSGNATSYLQYIGSLVGGIATLIALFITVEQTRKIQEDNKKQTITLKEIDKLKMQIEFSKNTFKIAHEYQSFLENLEKKLEKILRRTNLLDVEIDVDEEQNLNSNDVKHEYSYEKMKMEEDILEDLDIAMMIHKINSKMDSYVKRIMIESAAISNKIINSYVYLMFGQLQMNVELIGKIVFDNKTIEKVQEIFSDDECSINKSITIMIHIQSEIEAFIVFCQNQINNLIEN